MDKLTKEHRSWNMSRVKSKNTVPEVLMFKMLEDEGIRFEKHYPIFGKPDIAFPEIKLAVFIDGEFWHGKRFNDWRQTLSDFWFKKISENIEKDKNNRKLLRKEGWKILRIWGRDITRSPKRSFTKIIKFIEQNSQ